MVTQAATARAGAQPRRQMPATSRPRDARREYCMSTLVNELLRLQGDLESLLRTPRSDFFFGPPTVGVFPMVNVFRDAEGDVVIRAELPGVKPEDFNITVEGRRLTMTGERKPEGAEGGYHRRERLFGKFSRSIQLPEDLDVDAAS